MPEEAAVGAGIGILLAILIWAAIGLVIGVVARLILPGHQGIGMVGTVLCGIGGALIAGFIGRYIAEPLWVHLILSVVGAMILIGLLGGVGRRS